MVEKQYFYKGMPIHKNATSSYYICRDCGRPSSEMMPSESKHIPSYEQLKSRKFHQGIIQELLICPCGKENSWFDLKEVKTFLRTGLHCE